MPFNGAGNFVSLSPPQYPAVAGDVIRAAYFNAVISDLIAGLTNTVTRDGQSPATGNLPMAGKRHTGVSDATAVDQYATYGQLLNAPFTQSGTGAVLRTLPAKAAEFVTPADFGAVGDGVTDDTTALQNWANASGKKEGLPLVYKVTGTVTFSASTQIDFKGMTIDASAGGTFAGNAVVLFLGAITALPALSAGVAKDAKSVTFATAPTLSNGDIFCIYNPTNSSWSTIRTYYRAGEFCKAVNVAGSVVSLSNPLYDTYSIGVSLYRLAKMEVLAANLAVFGPVASAVPAIKASLCTKVRFNNVTVPYANYLGAYFDRCYDVETYAVTSNVPVTAAPDAYAYLVGNCQNVRAFGGLLYSKRGAFEVGGDDLVCAVPNRNVQAIGVHMENDFSTNFPACDLHGNLEDFRAVDCTIVGGASWAGVNNDYIDCDFRDAPAGLGALIYGGSEWLGGRARVSGGRMRGTPVYSTSGVIRIVTNDYAKFATDLYVENITDVEIGANTIFVKTEMGAAATKKSNVKVDGVAFSSAASLSQVVRCQGTGAGGDGDWVIVDRISGGPAGASLYISANGYGAATPCKLMHQEGSASLVMSTTNPTTSVTPAYRYSYGSKVPNLGGATLDTRLIGTKTTTLTWRLKNASSVTFDVGVYDNSNPTAAPTVTINYSVGVNEV